MMTEEEYYIHYPNKLLRIETGEQCRQLSIFEDPENGKLKENIIQAANKSIENVLHLNKNGNNSFSIEFPDSILNRLDSAIKQKVAKELSGNEIRVLTAIVGLAQKARSIRELHYWDKTNEAYFELKLPLLYEYSGLTKNARGQFNNRQKDLVKDALKNLHCKQFFIPTIRDDKNSNEVYNGIEIMQLIRIYKYEEGQVKPDENGLLRLTVNAVFFDFAQNRQNTYFNLPSDINKRLRGLSPGRPNVGIELFIKCLYQAIHCTREEKIEYSYNRLVEIMKLEKHKKNRNYSRVQATIDKAFDLSIRLGIISTVEEMTNKLGNRKYILFINNE